MHYLKIFYQLFLTDFYLIRKGAISSLVDTAIWITFVIGVVAYIFPLLGMSEDFGAFVLVNSVVSCALFQIFGNTAAVVGDLAGDYSLSYTFTLPLPAWVVWLEKVVAYAVQASIVSFIVLPLGLILLWGKFSLAAANWLLLPIVFILVQFFVAALTLCIIAFTPGMQDLKRIWPRFLFPIWYLGGTQFSWYTLKIYSPKVAWFMLCNPIMFASEGIRSVTLDPALSLPVWICILGMVCWTGVLLLLALPRLKKRLDTI